jgi:hypothetical protein
MINANIVVQHRARLRAALACAARELNAFPTHQSRDERVNAVRADVRQTLDAYATALLLDAIAETSDAPVRASSDHDRPLLAIDRPRVASSAR